MNSFVRNIGGSIGIAVMSTMLVRLGQKHQNYLSAHATPGNPVWDNMVNGMTQTLTLRGMDQVDATHRTYARLARMVGAQATTLAYIDVISYLALIVLCLAPFVLIMKRRKPGQAGTVPVH
jgi:DHA2 family multidrug resistance protein